MPPTVYPRVYGETASGTVNDTACTGLSPRVRGNPPRRDFGGVYPRVYGETYTKRTLEIAMRGLSPRVRGNRKLTERTLWEERSILACTGKPSPRSSCTSTGRVYPRVYGETVDGTLIICVIAGLSPRVRGNLVDGRAYLRGHGSIPACTGKP